MKFKGFYGEDIELKKREIKGNHNHLEILIDGESIGYVHISAISIHFFYNDAKYSNYDVCSLGASDSIKM